VVEQWSENSYYQYFCGETGFVADVPCEASELVHFHKRIGQQGITLILKESIRINGNDPDNPHVNVETTVQEKNVTFPTDAKLHRKIIKKCHQIARKEGLFLRRSYRRILKKLSVDQRFRNHPKTRKKALRADKRVKVIAGRLVGELERKLKSDHRLNRNFYKGIFGDNINIMLAAAAFNFKRMMNRWKEYFLLLFQNFIYNAVPFINSRDPKIKHAF